MSWGPIHPIPQNILHPCKRGLQDLLYGSISFFLFIPPNYCQKTCADPGHSFSLNMGEVLRAAPGFSFMFSQVSSAGRVDDAAREGRG